MLCYFCLITECISYLIYVYSFQQYANKILLCFKILSFVQSGPNSPTKESWGVNYRALNDLFHISRTRSTTFSYEIGVQMVEIYNEQVRDLLTSNAQQKRYPFMLHFLSYLL